MPLDQPTSNITEHTATITAAYLGNNMVAVDQIPAIIASVHAALGGVGTPTNTSLPVVMKPAVPVRRSVQPHAITCLDCGYQGQMLKRHLMALHALRPDDHRTRWGLPPEYPVVAPNYAVKRSALAKQIGLGTAHRRSAGLGARARQ
jgi:predicted transcriptional regulator